MYNRQRTAAATTSAHPRDSAPPPEHEHSSAADDPHHHHRTDRWRQRATDAARSCGSDARCCDDLITQRNTQQIRRRPPSRDTQLQQHGLCHAQHSMYYTIDTSDRHRARTYGDEGAVASQVSTQQIVNARLAVFIHRRGRLVQETHYFRASRYLIDPTTGATNLLTATNAADRSMTRTAAVRALQQGVMKEQTCDREALLLTERPELRITTHTRTCSTRCARMTVIAVRTASAFLAMTIGAAVMRCRPMDRDVCILELLRLPLVLLFLLAIECCATFTTQILMMSVQTRGIQQFMQQRRVR